MTSATHTPGPWTVGCPNGKRHYVMCGGHTVIAELPNTQAESSAYVIEQFHRREANARLIATAPDLLCMLQRVMDEICMTEAGMAHVAPLTLEQGRAALAKARGT